MRVVHNIENLDYELINSWYDNASPQPDTAHGANIASLNYH